MKKKILSLTMVALLALTGFTTNLEAVYTFRDGKLIDAKLKATKSLEEHYNLGVCALEAHNWRMAARQFGIVSANFPLSPYAQEACFFQGVAHYNCCEFDFADLAFTAYLECPGTPDYFEETMNYKFLIAEKFRNGSRRRFLGTQQLPKWASAETCAIKIYDEVIAGIPCNELAVQSLYSKALLQWKLRDYADAVECFQIITRRFPKHELAPECYLMINKVYLDQSRFEFQNPDILAFAEINVKRFKQAFPREERHADADESVLAIKEVYAQGFYDTGQFYERVRRPLASVLYYRYAALKFPETCVSVLCRERLIGLGYEICEDAAIEMPTFSTEEGDNSVDHEPIN